MKQLHPDDHAAPPHTVPRLLTPGPTPVLGSALKAQFEAATFHHRSQEFAALLLAARTGLQRFYCTTNDVLMLAASGTGALEACVVNTLNAGDKAVFINAGKFGERWAQMARTFGVDVAEIRVEWGCSVDIEAVAKVLKTHGGSVRGIYVQGCETSTGALMDVQALAKLASELPDCLTVVDGLTWLGAHDVRPNEWGLDLVACASQKALAAPPGLATISVSERAWRRIESVATPRYYFDLLREREEQARGTTAFTPAVGLMAAVKASLDWIDGLDGGVDGLIRNANRLARATRAAAAALGLHVVASQPADSMTALRIPPGIASGAVIDELRTRYGIAVADGQGSLKGQAIRIAHLGAIDAPLTMECIAALERILCDLGMMCEPGAGVAAARNQLNDRGR